MLEDVLELDISLFLLIPSDPITNGWKQDRVTPCEVLKLNNHTIVDL